MVTKESLFKWYEMVSKYPLMYVVGISTISKVSYHSFNTSLLSFVLSSTWMAQITMSPRVCRNSCSHCLCSFFSLSKNFQILHDKKTCFVNFHAMIRQCYLFSGKANLIYIPGVGWEKRCKCGK